MLMSIWNRINTDVAFIGPVCLFPKLFQRYATTSAWLSGSSFSALEFHAEKQERTKRLTDADQRGDEANREQNFNSLSGEHLCGDSDQTALPICQD